MLESGFSIEDTLAIHSVIALYGHLIDDRQFSRLNEIFTADAVFDLSGYGGERYQGLAAIEQLMLNSNEHPLAHHASNIVITADPAGQSATDAARPELALVCSKGLGVGAGGRVGSVLYRDRFVRVENPVAKQHLPKFVWRIQSRFCFLRRVDTIPEPS